MIDNKTIIEKALKAFCGQTGIDAAMAPMDAKNYPVEFLGKLTIKGPGQKNEYYVGVKKGITPAIIGGWMQTLQNIPGKTLLLTEYVAPPLAERLKKLDIQFIDTAGNAYINNPPLYIYVKGNKLQDNLRLEIGPRAFNRAGLTMIFALLCYDDLVNKPLREIAAYANVALGTVNNVFKDLKRKGYLIEKGGRQRRLVDKEKLIQQWATTYPDVLKPKLFLGKYTADDHEWWKDAQLPGKARWGGEVAAAKITSHLKPEEITIYAPEVPTELLLKYRLRKAQTGEITLLKTFWQQPNHWEKGDTVHPLLVYADLLATADSRNLEIAGMIYKDENARYI